MQEPAEALLAAWQQRGDAEALDALLRREIELLRQRLRRLYPNLVRPSLGATDAAQEAAFAMLRARPAPRFAHPEALRAYLLTAAWRLLLRRSRRAGAKVLRFDPAASQRLLLADASKDSVSGPIQRSERDTWLHLALNLLAAPEREILELVYFRQLQLAEAGRRLGIGEEAAKKRLARARAALAQRLLAWERVLD